MILRSQSVHILKGVHVVTVAQELVIMSRHQLNKGFWGTKCGHELNRVYMETQIWTHALYTLYMYIE